MPRKCNSLILFAILTGWSIAVQAAQKKALSERDLIELLAGGVYNARIVRLIHDRGISFVPTLHDLSSLRSAGADLALLNAVESARRITAQVPEPRKLHFERQLNIPPAVRPVESNPHNTPNVLPTPHGILQAAPVTSPKVQPQLPVPGSSIAGIPVGTVITSGNWRQYSQYMPVGMMELFKGEQYWKLPADVQIVVGPTIPEKLPAGYTEATRKYSGNVRVVHLADGRSDIRNYAGGEPFPDPEEPDRGYKLLADLWFAYVPHFLAGTPRNPLTICSETNHHYESCERLSYVYRQIAYNTDGAPSPEELKGSDYWYTEWLTVEEPRGIAVHDAADALSQR
jgi:Protein of unknown function (DUF1329)